MKHSILLTLHTHGIPTSLVIKEVKAKLGSEYNVKECLTAADAKVYRQALAVAIKRFYIPEGRGREPAVREYTELCRLRDSHAYDDNE